MKKNELRTSENRILTILSNITEGDNLTEVLNLVLNIDHLSELKQKRIENKRNSKLSFENFTDLEMIYYYIHQRKHIREEDDRKENTKREYARELFQFYSHLVNSREFFRQDIEDFNEGSLLKNLRSWHIENYQDMLSKVKLGKKKDQEGNRLGYSPATLHRKLVVLKSFLTWLDEVNYINEPLHNEIYSSSLKEKHIPNKDLYYSEVIQLLEYYKDHPINHCLLTVLALTGLRINEIASAKWKDLYIHPANGKYYLKVIGKNEKEIHALIHNVVFNRIITFRKRRRLTTVLDPNNNGPIFTTNKGKPYSYKYLSNYVTDIIYQTNLPFLKYKEERVTPHSFRHFFAIYSRRQGADVYDIQKRLGHSSITITQRYLDKDADLERDPGLLWDEGEF